MTTAESLKTVKRRTEWERSKEGPVQTGSDGSPRTTAGDPGLGRFPRAGPPAARVQDRAHEAALIADDAACPVGQLQGLPASEIPRDPRAMGLVGGQAGKAEQRHGDAVGALGGQEVAVMDPAHPVDQRYPQFRIGLELGQLVRVDDVAQVAGDRPGSAFDDLARVACDTVLTRGQG